MHIVSINTKFMPTGLLKCLVCDETLFHATCGRMAGVSFEFRNWPDLAIAVCPEHNEGFCFLIISIESSKMACLSWHPIKV